MQLHEGSQPLVISLPHVGTELPADIASQLTARARQVEDTDWHVDQLYAFAKDAGASWVAARYSRYVVDLNRPPDNASLYPGQATTGLVPTESFDGESLYEGLLPDAQELQARRHLPAAGRNRNPPNSSRQGIEVVPRFRRAPRRGGPDLPCQT